MKDLPPSIAYCISKGTYLSGSEFYRAHRPVHVLGHKKNWLTFLATHFVLPEKAGESWQINVPFPREDGSIDERVVTPQVIVTRPIWHMEDDTDGSYEAVARITQSIAYAQEAGQIIIADIDDHPYGWNQEYADKTQNEPITDWSWHDNWLTQCNAVFTSTRWLQNFLGDRFPDLPLVYAPNLYDPYRYEDCKPQFGKTLGAHLFLSARLRSDFERLGEVLLPIFQNDSELRFIHVGEEFKCKNCNHAVRDHFEGKTYCAECACEVYMSPGMGHQLATFTGLPAERIDARAACSLMDLPSAMDWSVGVVPMADSEFNYAKTEGKGFEMAAAGIPFIALTGEHPLYKHIGVDFSEFPGGWEQLLNDFYQWEHESNKARRWAIDIAQEHQRDYLAAMDELARIDLRKTRMLAH